MFNESGGLARQALVWFEEPGVFAIGAFASGASVDGVAGDDDEVAEVWERGGAGAGSADALGDEVGRNSGGGGEVDGGGEIGAVGALDGEDGANEEDEEDRG